MASNTIKIWQREYKLPRLQEDSLQKLEQQIEAAHQRLAEGKVLYHEREVEALVEDNSFFGRLFGNGQKNVRQTVRDASKRALTIDEQFAEVDQIVRHYRQMIANIKIYKVEYIRFFQHLEQDVKAALLEKCQNLYRLESKRLAATESLPLEHPLRHASIQQSERMLNTVEMIGQAVFLMLKKIRLFQEGLQELAENHQQQQAVLLTILAETERYRAFYELEKEIAQAEKDAQEMMNQALNFEQVMREFLGPFDQLIKHVSRSDPKLARSVREIQELTQDILTNDKLQINEQTDNTLLEFLMRTHVSQDLLTELLQQSSWESFTVPPDLSVSTEEKQSVFAALDNLQVFINCEFQGCDLQRLLDEDEVNNENEITPLSVDFPLPEMVRIPAGQFEMGSNRHLDEHPIHTVTLGYDFAIDKYPVTFEEYDAYCEAVDVKKPSDRGWGRGKRPVINVNWHDAVNYCQWLSEQTGQHYRLPSEAEWEYACRAGTTTAYWWGDKMDAARCWYGKNSGKKTHLVDEAEVQHANPWGLVDMLGHVWEWCQDTEHNSYEGAPTDGSAWVDDGNTRLLRGGSWYNDANYCRSAYRGYYSATGRHYDGGFRICARI